MSGMRPPRAKALVTSFSPADSMRVTPRLESELETGHSAEQTINPTEAGRLRDSDFRFVPEAVIRHQSLNVANGLENGHLLNPVE